MVSIYDLKPAFQGLLRPLAANLNSYGISPNEVTLGALSLSVLQGALIALYPGAVWPLWLMPFTLFLRMALNAIDGMIAREYGKTSRAGKYLNEIGDVVSDLALYLPFLLVLPTVEARWLFVAFLIGIPASEMSGMLSEVCGGTRRYDGPMGKSDRAFALGLLAVVVALYGNLPTTATLYAAALCALVWVTTYRRYANGVPQ